VAAVLRPLGYGSSLTVIPVMPGLWERGDASTRAACPRWLATLATVSGGSFLVSSAEMLGLPDPAFIATVDPVLSVQ
jgi:hypothetical protein